MGFLLTILYVTLTITSPSQFGVEFASYHPMVYLAALTTVASLPQIFARLNSRPAVQIHLGVLFVIAIAISQLHNGVRAVNDSLLTALPTAAVLFFVIVNVNTFRRVKIMIWVIIATCFGLTIEALCGFYYGFQSDLFVLLQFGVRRLRSTGFLNDPNDFAQFILIVLPLLFVGWNRGRVIVNSLFVIPPCAFLLWAMYLTHSRGALVALGVLLLAAFYKKIGVVPSAALAVLLIFGLLALDFTAGRGMSAADGSDRLELWAEGLQYFKRAPLFGIGFGEFADSDFSGLTAHNSFILCLAELGIVGSTLFVGLLVTAFLGLNKLIDVPQPSLAESVVEDVTVEENGIRDDVYPSELATYDSEGGIVASQSREQETESATKRDVFAVKSYAGALRMAFISFLTTSCFLSRSYTATMFLMIGLAASMGALEPESVEVGELRRQMLVTFAVEILAIGVVYGLVRLRT